MQPWQSVRTLGPLLSVWKSAISFLHLPAELKYWLLSTFVSVFPSLTGELPHGALIKFHDLFLKIDKLSAIQGQFSFSTDQRFSWLNNKLSIQAHIGEFLLLLPCFIVSVQGHEMMQSTCVDSTHGQLKETEWKKALPLQLWANTVLAFWMFALPFCISVCTVCVCVWLRRSWVFFVLVSVYLMPVSQFSWTVNRFTANWMASQTESFACCVRYEKILSGREREKKKK